MKKKVMFFFLAWWIIVLAYVSIARHAIAKPVEDTNQQELNRVLVEFQKIDADKNK